MRVKLQTASLRETQSMEYVQRFIFGGVVTVVAGLIAKKWGPVVGGLFLAFPGILPCGVSLVEKHKTAREAKEGKRGVVSARGEASVEATGAAAGAIGLAAFGAVLWWMLPAHGLAFTLASASAAWVIVGVAAWKLREML